MPIQHKYKPHHLVLAIALAVGCAEFSLAQQLEPKVDADTKPTKTRKKATKPVAPTGSVFEEATVGASALTMEAAATLSNAGMNVVALPGNRAQSTVQTVLNAGNVEGEFGEVTSNLAFMTPEASYSDTQGALTRNDVPLETVATSASGQALARSVDTPKTVITNAAIGALLASNKANAVVAIEQLAASSNANLAKATLSSVSPVSASMLSAMRQLDNGTGTFSNKAPRLATGSENSSRVWLQALGNGGKVESDVDNTLKYSTQGLVLGADWRLDQQWHVGVMGGKSQTKLDARQFDGDLDSWHLGAYAVRQDGPLALRLGATYANHEGSSKRRVAFNGFSDRLKGSYDANTQQAFAEAGFNLGRNNVTIEPFASVGYQRYQRENHTEKGGDAALKVYGQTQDNFSSTFGLRAAKLNTLDNGMHLTPRFSAGWKHIYGELGSETRQQLVKGGKRFDIAGAAFDRDSLSLDAGLDLELSANHTLGVGLTGEIGSDSRSHGVMGQWRMAF
ncbi:autotransporter outer membrane beta-barrel domain-containing protein [Pseudomonas frederiksbergensis]|uniref:autotransporter outer membrane beta-barrel domain-containing protein n=1 Tax=Pseudomonas frederiksbergensis TaxID=104087 RepID=UPI003D22269A